MPWGSSYSRAGRWGSAPVGRQYGGSSSPAQGSRNPMMQGYQRAYNQAQQANRGRYEDIIGLLNQRQQAAQGLIETQGKSQMVDLNQRYDEQGASQQQALVGRGLSNTTVTATLQNRNTRERGRAQNALQENINRQKLGVGLGTSGDIASFMERRTDAYPDLGQYMQAAQMQGRGQQQNNYWSNRLSGQYDYSSRYMR